MYNKHSISKEAWEHSRYADAPFNIIFESEKLN